jgi:hypothetical protein
MAAASDGKLRRLKATYVTTFVYVDEPQVILLDRGRDPKVIGVAIDRGGMAFPFLGAEISTNQLERYQREFVDLRYLFDMPYYHRWYLFDLGTMSKENKSIWITEADKEDYQNEDYLPARQFFARQHTEPMELPALAAAGVQRHMLDGNWEASDYSKLVRQVGSLYAFYLAIQRLKSATSSAIQKSNLRKAFTEYPFRGGSSYVNFYNDLIGALAFHERVATGAIQKASPGFIDVEGDMATLGQVVDAMKHFQAGYETLEPQYKFLHEFLSSLDFLTAAPDQIKLTTSTARSIEGHARKLADGMGLSYDVIDQLAGNPLSTAKIVLAHYRRLDRYFLFFAEGRARLPSDEDDVSVANSPSIAAKPDA